MLWLLTPVAWPLGRLLDHLIPHGAQSISRREVTALVEVTREMAKLEVASGHAANNPDGLTEVEERLVRGSLTLTLTLTLTLPLPLPLTLTPPLPLSRSSSWAAASEAASGRSFATRPLRRCAWRTSGRPCGTGRYASSGGHLPWAAVASTHLRRSSARRWRRSRLPTSWSAPRPLARVRLHSSKQETPRPSS